MIDKSLPGLLTKHKQRYSSPPFYSEREKLHLLRTEKTPVISISTVLSLPLPICSPSLVTNTQSSKYKILLLDCNHLSHFLINPYPSLTPPPPPPPHTHTIYKQQNSQSFIPPSSLVTELKVIILRLHSL